jgi:hypothetical protein
MMRQYISLHPRQGVALSTENLEVLDVLRQQATGALNVAEQAQRNELAARILSLYALKSISRIFFPL